MKEEVFGILSGEEVCVFSGEEVCDVEEDRKWVMWRRTESGRCAGGEGIE